MDRLQHGEPEKAGMSSRRLGKVDSLINGLVISGCFPGAVLLVARRGKIVHYRAYGLSALLPEREIMRKDTIFDLASLTKVVATAPLIMSLVEDGLLRLDEPVSYYFPSFSGGKKDKVTIWHLLTHTSGLPAHVHLYSLLGSRDEVAGYITSLDLAYEPGSRVVYSDLGFILLGFIAEKATGEGLDVAARERIFKPLGMSETMFKPAGDFKERCAATEYCCLRRRYLKGEVHDENAWFMGGVAGHAGLFSTAVDLAVFGQMMLNGGRYGGRRILSSAAVKAMVRNHTGGLGEPRGLGWAINERPCSCGDLMSPRAYGHTGFTGTSLWIDPENEVVVVFLTNRVHPTRQNTCISRARPLVHNVIMSAILK